MPLTGRAADDARATGADAAGGGARADRPVRGDTRAAAGQPAAAELTRRGRRAPGRAALAWPLVASATALLVAACGLLGDDGGASASPSPSPPATTTPVVTTSPPPPPGEDTFLSQLDEQLPDLARDDQWKLERADEVCLFLDGGMTLRAAATSITAITTDTQLSVADALVIARLAVPNLCDEHADAVAQEGNDPLDQRLDPNGQGACFFLDFARYQALGGAVVGDLDLAYSVATSAVLAQRSRPPSFNTAWHAMTSDISSPDGMAERRALCAVHGWTGDIGRVLPDPGGGAAA